MARRAHLALVLAAACGDPSVRVRFEVPAGYEDLVDSVALEVLAPESDSLDCDAVALGNAGAQELAAARVAQAVVRESGDHAPLSGIPRTGRKLFVARALSESGQLVAGGCAEVDDIEGNEDVEIEGERALTLGGRDLPTSGPLPSDITILVSDARGQPAGGVVAQQTMLAAADTAAPGEPATSSAGGVLRFEVEQPAWAGPQVLDVDVRWQANQRDLVAGFKTPFTRFTEPVPSATEPEALSPRAMYQVGHIGPDGEMGAAVLGRDPGTGMRPVHLYYLDPAGETVVKVTSDSPIRANAIGMVQSGERDLVVAMNPTTWYEIEPDGVVVEKHPSGLIDATALSAYATSCELGGPRDRLLAVGGGGVPALYEPDGSKVAGWRGAQLTGVRGLLAAGCVRGLEVTYPAVVYSARPDGGEDRPLLVIDAPGTEPTTINAAAVRGIAFSPRLETGEGPFLLANRFENDGNSIARYTVVPVEGAPTFLDESDEDEIAGLSETTAGGDFDGDGLLDVAAMVTVPTGDGRGVVFRFFMALGIVVEEQRLFGLGATGVDDPDFAPILLAADFDADGVDELFVATTEGFSVFELQPD